MVDRLIRFCLENKLVVGLFVLFAIVAGVIVAPFDWETPWIERNPVPVDAIPDIGENQQIVFTRWIGRSPQDIEDQISYPLTVALLGIPGVKTVRAYSVFGFSSIYIIFKDEVEFYWSRSRVLEKLNALPPGTLPAGTRPMLGPDATGLGQVFWYTLEGRDAQGRPAGGWGPEELRTIQDWYVRFDLSAVDGVAEVASIGGFVKEYQIDVDPDAMRAHRVTLQQVRSAVRMSNIDVGARTIEVNNVEYVIRGRGFIKDVQDILDTVIAVRDSVPIYVKHVATVSLGPALRRGALDKGGAEATGGVVVARYGANPLAAIKGVKKKIEQIAPSLPKKTLPDGTVSQVTIVPFYDRTGLIYETLGTLRTALVEEMLVTIIVVLVMVFHLRSSLLISGLLPLTVLLCFLAMKIFGVDANVVALSGIAIAIGTIVDMGIVVCENILKHLDAADPETPRIEVIFAGASEVGGAVLTAISTTVVSFLPVFTMQAAEGKLFKPLAYTKTFALLASVVVALTVIPPLAHLLFTRELKSLRRLLPAPRRIKLPWLANGIAIAAVGLLLTRHWMPLGPELGLLRNLIFVGGLIGGLLGLLAVFQWFYVPILRWCLAHKKTFLALPLLLVLWGLLIWFGFDRLFGCLPGPLRRTAVYSKLRHAFPALGKEFMPKLDEGTYLYMPTTSTHASIGEAIDVLAKQDKAIAAIPEIESVVGKIGRAESPLDPAPISMVETVINYKPEYVTGKDGRRLRFRFDERRHEFVRDAAGKLIEDRKGRLFRQWRPHIKKPDDIWKEIVEAARVPGSTDAPRLQPIETRIVMLQSGFRAAVGVKVKGADLATIERVGIDIEKLLKKLPAIESRSVYADRIVGKPYLEIAIDRRAIARYGVHLGQVQQVIEVAIGGEPITVTVEGRERYPVRVRYQRELRDSIESLGRILVPTASGAQVPLAQMAQIEYARGPQMIKTEDTFKVGYVIFDMRPGHAEVDVVESAQRFLAGQEQVFEEARAAARKQAGRELTPAEIDALPGLNRRGCKYDFAGSYENQVRSEKRLRLVLPLALFVIFLILYLQFHSVSTTLIIFSGVFVAGAGGFQMLWLYGQDWFLDFSVFHTPMRELFGVRPYNLSVAVWVGFLALFGIATDDGVVMGTYLEQRFRADRPRTVEAIREATVFAGARRIRPCLMTTATTILALLPVLTSTGRGADVMVPMAIPSFGGMTIELITMFVVPTLYCAAAEWRLHFQGEAR